MIEIKEGLGSIESVKHFQHQRKVLKLPKSIETPTNKSFPTSLILQFSSFLNFKFTPKGDNFVYPKAKLTKLEFFNRFILNNKKFFLCYENRNIQLCTTSIGKVLGVSPPTIMNWIKELINLGLLECTNTHWLTGKYAKRYQVIDTTLLYLMNKHNGYQKEHGLKNKESLNLVVNKVMRRKRIKEVDPVLPTAEQFTKLAQQFLGDPHGYFEVLDARCGKTLLQPSDQKHVKHLETFGGTALRVFSYVMRRNDVRRTSKKCIKYIQRVYKNPLFFASRKIMESFYQKHFSHLKRYAENLKAKLWCKSKSKKDMARVFKLNKKLDFVEVKRSKRKNELNLSSFFGKARIVRTVYSDAVRIPKLCAI